MLHKYIQYQYVQLEQIQLYIKYNGSVAFEINATNLLYNL